jgi:hypothetical protein
VKFTHLVVASLAFAASTACRRDATAPGPSGPSRPAPRSNPGPSDARARFVQSDAEPYDFALEPESIDLGVLRPDEDASCDFTIVNRDARPLPLCNVTGSCECLGIDWERGDLAPGERRKVHVRVRAENRGDRQLEAIVQAFDKKATKHEVAISYVVLPDLAFQPERVDFGKRVLGSSSRVDVQVAYVLPHGAAPIDFTTRLAKPLPVTAELGAATVKERPGGLLDVTVPLRLTLDASGVVTPFDAALTLESPRCKPGRLALSGEVHRGFYLDPDVVQIGVTKVGAKREGSVRLLWTKEQPRVDALECSVDELHAEAVLDAPGRNYKIKVVYEAKSAGDVDAEVRIRTDLAAEPLLLHVRGKVR